MNITPSTQNICPYCLNSILSESKDHIFPQFLGGTAKIITCENCNNTFGHTFEAKAAKILQPVYFIISGWGISLKNPSPTLKVEHQQDGKAYNLFVTETGMKYSLAKPIIEYDKDGQIQSGQFTEMKHAEQFAKNLIAKGKAKEMILENLQTSNVDVSGLDSTLEIGPDLSQASS